MRAAKLLTVLILIGCVSEPRATQAKAVQQCFEDIFDAGADFDGDGLIDEATIGERGPSCTRDAAFRFANDGAIRRIALPEFAYAQQVTLRAAPKARYAVRCDGGRSCSRTVELAEEGMIVTRTHTNESILVWWDGDMMRKAMLDR